MVELLAESLKAERRDCPDEEERNCLGKEEVQDIYLPDKDGWLHPVTKLSLDCCDWLEESESMHFLHPKFSEHLARVFRVRTKQEHDEVSGLSYFLQVHS